MSAQLLKSLHLLGVVLFVGNIVVTAVWKVLADRTRNPAVIGYAQRLVTVTDIAFTATGAGLIAVSGAMMADRFGGVGWLTLGVGLFIASGVIWVTTLIPIQVAQALLARRFAAEGAIPDRYWRLATLWYAVGTIAIALPLVNVYVMVVKP